jgi:hypothetical protein
MAILPLTESSEEINTVLSGILNAVTGRQAVRAKDPNEAKNLEEEDDSTPPKAGDDVEEPADVVDPMEETS